MKEESENFNFEFTICRVDSFGNYLLFGYPVLGGWLPYLGFDTAYGNDDDSDPTVSVAIKYFIAEWFVRGIHLEYAVEVRLKEDNDG